MVEIQKNNDKFLRYYFYVFIVKANNNEKKCMDCLNNFFDKISDCTLEKLHYIGKKETAFKIKKKEPQAKKENIFHYFTSVISLVDNSLLQKNLKEITRLLSLQKDINIIRVSCRRCKEDVLEEESNLRSIKTYTSNMNQRFETRKIKN
ncbi:hypothetical protein AB836_01275 [Rickettsiales bacterium (ex Bugula neritina AB1)]|nr:hypothetical protein AB836_01275 [Rickettsiales bacterium (ex Bugula neritina AB1)]